MHSIIQLTHPTKGDGKVELVILDACQLFLAVDGEEIL